MSDPANDAPQDVSQDAQQAVQSPVQPIEAVETQAITPVEFFRGLFGDEWPGWLVLWRSDTKRSVWLAHDELDGVADVLAPCLDTNRANLYYGVGLQGNTQAGGRGSETMRGTASGVIAIPGLWMDIDTREGSAGKRSRKNYPPLDVAMRAIHEMPVQPSVIVNSGGGLHVYWLFHELLDTSTYDLRRRASSLTTGWEQVMASRLLAAGGYELDRVSDLARVLRVVCGWNWSQDRPVQLLPEYTQPQAWARFSPEDFEPYIGENAATVSIEFPLDQTDENNGHHDHSGTNGHAAGHAPAHAPRQTQQDRAGGAVGDDMAIHASPTAEPPRGLFDALMNNVDGFASAYNGTRQFASNSECELSLANYAVQAGWRNQDIANLIIAHRRFVEPAKLSKVLRIDYLVRTIRAARGNNLHDLAVASLRPASDVSGEELAAASANVVTAPDASDPGVRSRAIESLSAMFRVRVQRWVQLGLENPIYELHCVHGDTTLRMAIGSTQDVISGDGAIRRAIYAHTGVLMQSIKRDVWQSACANLAIIRELHLSESSENLSALRDHVERYLSACDFPPKAQAMTRLAPFVEGGRVWLSMPTLLRWVNTFGGERWERRWLYTTMRALGWDEQVVQMRIEGRVVAKRYWFADAIAWESSLPNGTAY